MKDNVKVHLHLDSHKRKTDGKSKFSLRVAIGRDKKLYPVFPKRSNQPFMDGRYWVNETCEETGVQLKSKRIKHGRGNADSRQLETALMRQLESMKGLIEKLENEDRKLTHELLKLHWQHEHFTTFSDWLGDWLERYVKIRNIRESTVNCYRRNHIYIQAYERTGQQVNVGAVTATWLYGFQEWLLKSWGLHSRTTRNVMNQIGYVMRFAKANGALYQNAYQDFIDKKLMVKAETHPGAYLVEEEVERMYQAYINEEILLHPQLARKNGTPSVRSEKLHGRLAMALFVCFSGMRIGDLIRISENHPTFEIGPESFSIEMEKTRRTITIPISERMRTVANMTGVGPVFATRFCERTQMTDSLRQIIALLGIPKHITFHSLRRSFASYMLNQDVPLKVVSELLGHANTMVTEQRYAFLNDKRLKEAIAVFDKTEAAAFEDPKVREFVEDVYQLLQANPGLRLPKRMQDRMDQLKEQLGLDVLDLVSRQKGMFRAV